jgi:NADH:ubiquinone oxidoreductase subunit C
MNSSKLREEILKIQGTTEVPGPKENPKKSRSGAEEILTIRADEKTLDVFFRKIYSLRGHLDFFFGMMGDHSPTEGKRVLYFFCATKLSLSVVVAVNVSPEEDSAIPTLSALFPSASIFEKEIYELFGYRFSGKGSENELRPKGMTAFPLGGLA